MIYLPTISPKDFKAETKHAIIIKQEKMEDPEVYYNLDTDCYYKEKYQLGDFGESRVSFKDRFENEMLGSLYGSYLGFNVPENISGRIIDPSDEDVRGAYDFFVASKFFIIKTSAVKGRSLYAVWNDKTIDYNKRSSVSYKAALDSCLINTFYNDADRSRHNIMVDLNDNDRISHIDFEFANITGYKDHKLEYTPLWFASSSKILIENHLYGTDRQIVVDSLYQKADLLESNRSAIAADHYNRFVKNLSDAIHFCKLSSHFEGPAL